jgi:hypothetical protein
MIDIDPLYTHVVISFVQPDIAYVKNSNSFQGTGIGFSATFDAVKEAVKLLKAKNVKVLLAVGGATYNNWTALANNTGAHRQTRRSRPALPLQKEIFPVQLASLWVCAVQSAPVDQPAMLNKVLVC